VVEDIWHSHQSRALVIGRSGLLLPATEPTIGVLQLSPLQCDAPFAHYCFELAVVEGLIFIELGFSDNKMLFFVYGTNGGPFTIDEFFGVNGVHNDGLSGLDIYMLTQ
jgi:hypothetical protein